MKKYLLLLFLLSVYQLIYANNHTPDLCDSLLKESFNRYVSHQLDKSLQLANTAVEISKSIDYTEGQCKGYVYVAKVLIDIGKSAEALSYLAHAEKKLNFKENLIMKIETFRLKGRVYGNLNFNELAVQQFRNQLSNSYQIQDTDKRALSILWSYQNLTVAFENMQVKDSIVYYLFKQLDHLGELNENKFYYEYINVYAELGKYYIDINDLQLAEKYFKKSNLLIAKYNSTYKYYTLQRQARLEVKKKNYIEAEKLYNDALANIIQVGDINSTSDLYKEIAFFMLDHRHKDQLANEYFVKHQTMEDSILINNKSLEDTVVKHIKNSVLEENKWYFSSGFRIFVVIITIITIILIIIIYRNKKIRRLKRAIIENYSKKTSFLEEQISDKRFAEMIEMAKRNRPEFIIKFQEIYPQFSTRLKEKNPDITTSELTFCAFAFLKFSTKDIAEYTNVTVRAVQIRKNRFRKKMNIPSDIDFNEWLNDINI